VENYTCDGFFILWRKPSYAGGDVLVRPVQVCTGGITSGWKKGGDKFDNPCCEASGSCSSVWNHNQRTVSVSCSISDRRPAFRRRFAYCLKARIDRVDNYHIVIELTPVIYWCRPLLCRGLLLIIPGSSLLGLPRFSSRNPSQNNQLEFYTLPPVHFIDPVAYSAA